MSVRSSRGKAREWAGKWSGSGRDSWNGISGAVGKDAASYVSTIGAVPFRKTFLGRRRLIFFADSRGGCRYVASVSSFFV